MSKIVTLDQLVNQAQRTAANLDKKPDKSETISNVQVKADGVEFVDGNGNVVYKIPVMKE